MYVGDERATGYGIRASVSQVRIDTLPTFSIVSLKFCILK